MVRSPMQVDGEFHKRMKELQKEIMKTQGEFKGFPKIQKEIIQMPEWDMIEKKLKGDVKQIEFKIKFDRRKGK